MATEQPTPKPARKKPRQRHYDMDDALLLQRSRTLRHRFLNNLAVFIHALYKFYTTVHLAAQTAFADDKERRDLFNMT